MLKGMSVHAQRRKQGSYHNVRRDPSNLPADSRRLLAVIALGLGIAVGSRFEKNKLTFTQTFRNKHSEILCMCQL